MPVGVAVSGGGDSMALLHWLASEGRAAAAVTVDHGLRVGAAAEAAFVARACADLGVPHSLLRWRPSGGNLQAAARDGRRALIADWARGRFSVALGHTLDDQAETVALRLARGSGVDGLAAMAPERHALGVTWLRPFLGTSRAALRRWLTARGIQWAEDPSNEDRRFDRVRARHAIAALDLAPLRLAATAERMAAARVVLADAALALMDRAVRIRADGAAILDRAAFAAAREDTRDRLRAALLMWIGNSPYRPRLAALRGAFAGGTRTLAGCVVAPGLVRREPRALPAPVPVGVPWDGRWHVQGPAGTIGALGADLEVADWRGAGLERAAAAALPAVRVAGDVVATPLSPGAWRFGCDRIALRKGVGAD